jgi:23S rRNA pseudouridine1911/1915/1917 synthase
MPPGLELPVMPLAILHDSGGVLAVAKPAGLATQAPPGIESAELWIRNHLFGTAVAADREAGRRRHPGGFLGVPHRLDRAVSGVLLFATTPRAARQLARQFERRQVRKTYRAIVAATAAEPLAAGERLDWHDTIRKVPDEARAEIVPAGTPGGRAAVTTGTVLAALPDGTLLLELEPLTGRMHQLRVQAASRSLPVVGDLLYGGRPSGDAAPADARTSPIALHAWQITFHDPDSGEPITVTCPPPAAPPWPTGPAMIDPAAP